MTGPELDACLAVLGWSLRHLAERTGLAPTTIRRMEAGTRPIEPDLAKRIRAAARSVEQHFPTSASAKRS